MTTTCPFCNAAVPVPTPLTCPRCEERLPGGTATAAPARAKAAANPLWFRVGFPLSCAVSILALVGGLYLVNRGESKPTPVTAPGTATDVGPATVPPLGLTGVGYLPSDVQVVAAVQVGPLQSYAARTNADAKRLLADAGLPPSLFDSLATAGVPLESIHHAALGLTVPPDNALPGVSLAVALTAPPADADGLVKRLGQIKLFNLLPVSAVIANERYLLIGTDVAVFPKSPRPPGAEHLPKAMRDTIGRFVSPSSVAWLVTDTTSWHDLPGVRGVLLASKRSDLTPYVKRARSLGVSFSLEPEFTMGLAVRCDTDGSAKALRDHFGTVGAGQPWLIGGEESWATLDAAVPPKDVPKLLTSLLPNVP
jgi:hypothetical protein